MCFVLNQDTERHTVLKKANKLIFGTINKNSRIPTEDSNLLCLIAGDRRGKGMWTG